MKKSLVALAALAVVGAASAQSSVTMYGLIDIGYGGATKNGADTKFQMQDSFNSTSRIGFKGTEDLGGGLKANFDLQTGNIGNETGSANLAFGRAAWAGLSGGFGDVKFGRIVSKPTQIMVGFDLNGVSSSSAAYMAGIQPVVWYGSSRRSSQLQYTLPIGDATLHLAETLKNDNTGGKNALTLGAGYGAGPLSLGFVLETKRSDANRSAWALGGKYNMGSVILAGTVVQSESVAAGKGFSLGVMAPLGQANVGLQFARNTANKFNATELFANYSLSKRTSLYSDFVFGSKTAGGSNKAYGLGVIHTF